MPRPCDLAGMDLEAAVEEADKARSEAAAADAAAAASALQEGSKCPVCPVDDEDEGAGGN